MNKENIHSMTVLDTLVAMRSSSQDVSSVKQLTDHLETLSRNNETKVQQHLYSYLNQIIMNALKKNKVDSFLISDMEIRVRIYEIDGHYRCALALEIIPSLDFPGDSDAILKSIVFAVKKLGLQYFVNDICINDKQAILRGDLDEY